MAPPLLWIEVTSALHAAVWRRELTSAQGEAMQARAAAAPITCEEPDALQREAWLLADELGWAKTYDANYVALARMIECRLVTLDARLRRGTTRLGFVVGPTEV